MRSTYTEWRVQELREHIETGLNLCAQLEINGSHAQCAKHLERVQASEDHLNEILRAYPEYA